jgi:hypothetical protein
VPDLDVRLLGALEVAVDGQVVDLGGPRQRAVLALLLVAHGEVVSVDRLIDDLCRANRRLGPTGHCRPTSPTCAGRWSRSARRACRRAIW